MKVLIVEDDIVSRNLMQAILNPYANCEVAANGREAVELFISAFNAETPYDLVCMDIMMPEKNGHEALKEIRSFEESQGIGQSKGAKVIMTTALSDFKNVAEAFKSQCEGYLVKPIRKEKLLKTIQELIPEFDFL
ncbi:response regulator [bacterium]|nr:response regulator [bacterium]